MEKVFRILISTSLLLMSLSLAVAQTVSGSGHTTLTVGNYPQGSILPTGQVITPTAAPGSTIQVLSTGLRSDGGADAAEAVNTALSPDGKLLLVLTSGWNKGNRRPDGTPIAFPTLDPKTGAAVGTTTLSEWVFVYAINDDGTITKLQQLNIPSTYSGLAWAPDGSRFYVSGGQDDRIYIYISPRIRILYRMCHSSCSATTLIKMLRSPTTTVLSRHKSRAGSDICRELAHCRRSGRLRLGA